MRFWVLYFVGFLLINLVAFAQEYDVKTTTVNDYLGRETFGKGMVIDSNNHLWVTSSTHLIKKIGSEDVYFEYNHPYKKGLDNRIILVEAENDKIIGFTCYGIFEFSIKNTAIKWIYIKPKRNKIRLNSYSTDDKGNIWVGTINGHLYHYSPKDGLEVRDFSELIEKKYNSYEFKVVRALSDNSVLICIIDKKSIIQDLYTCTNDRLELVFENKTFKNRELAYTLNVVENGKLFPKDTSGRYSFEGDFFHFYYVPEIDSHVFKLPLNFREKYRRILHFKDDIFIAYSSIDTELVLFSLNSNLEIVVHKKFSGFQGNIEDVFVHKDVVWLNHFSRFTSITLKPLFFKNIFLKKTKLSDNRPSTFRSIIKSNNGDLFAIIKNKLYIIDKEDNTPKKVEYTSVINNTKKLGALYGLKVYNDSIFFAYGWGKKIFKINQKSETYEAYYLPDSNLDVKDAELIKDNRLLLGTTKGLYEFNCQTNNIKEYVFENSNNLKNISVNDIYLDKLNKQLWVGAIDDGGLYKKDLQSGEILHYSTSSKKLELINNDINCLFPDPDDTNILWIGTERGLQKLDIKTNTSQFFLANNQLTSRVVSIVKAEKMLFVGTYDGLVTIDSENNIRRYDEHDGLPNKEFNKKSFYYQEHDSIYLGTLNGLAVFDPKTLAKNVFNKCKLELVEVYQWDFDKNEFRANDKNIQHQSVFNISHKKNYLKLKFSVNSLINPEDIEYKYKLDTDNGWISLRNSNTLNLASLSSGRHSLTVQAIDSRGVLTNKLKYKIKVSQVFYKQGWFLLMSVSLGLVLFYRYFYEKEKKEKQRYSISLLKSQALLTQMTPHFINNVLNGIQSKIILKDEIAVNNYIKSFSNLCKYTLNINSSQFISLEEEINYLDEFLSISQMKLDNALDYKIIIKDNFCLKNTYIPTMLLQPIIENAIEHGLLKKDGEKVLSVVFYKKSHKLYVEIEDNGIGRKAASLNQAKKNKDSFKRPHALEILKKRRKALNSMFNINLDYEYQDVYTKNSENINVLVGTKVILSLKICNTDFS